MGRIFLWVLFPIILLVLLAICIAYWQGVFRARKTYKIQNFPATTAANFPIAIASLSDSFLEKGQVCNFWQGAEDIFAARIAAIGKAAHTIQFETFIITPGKRADDFAQALIEKAQSGVRVQVIADSYGARKMPSKYWHQLQAVGIKVLLFNTFSWRHPSAYLQRNHRKLLLIDGKTALIGGAGVSDLWDGEEYHQPWLDYEVCLQGALISRLQGIFQQHWLDAGGSIDEEFPHITSDRDPQQTLLITPGEDPSTRDAGIRALFQTFLEASRTRVWIASPYFLPDNNTRRFLQQVRARGVDIKILTMGVRNDKPPIRYASRQLYPQLIKAGIEIYEYQPNMMHAKGLLIDNEWVSLGSANFDPRSMFHNDELNFSSCDRNLLERVEKLFWEAFSHSHLVSKRELRDRSLRERLIGQFTLLFQWHL